MADLAARHRRVGAAVEAAVTEVLRSGRYVGGAVVERTLAAVAQRFGWRHGVGVNSGTDALIYGLQALGVRAGDEVVVPAVTFFATAGAVCRVGAVPVVADVRADLPLLDGERLPLSPRTRAVVAVHLYGEACPLPALPVPVLDDSAQAAGADPPPRTGVAAAVSFYPTKTLGAAGDGGAVLTDDEELADRVRRLTHHGIERDYTAEAVDGVVGANSRLDPLQAAVLGVHLADLPRRVARRREIAARYDAELPAWVGRLPRSAGHPVHQYVVTVPDRHRVVPTLAVAGVHTAVYYPVPLSAQPALVGRARVPHATPHADAFCAACLALPVHEELGDDEVDRVLAAFRRLDP